MNRRRRLSNDLKLTLEEATREQTGFSDQRLGKPLPSPGSAACRKIRKLFKSADLFKSSGHQILLDCIMNPHFDDRAKEAKDCYSEVMDAQTRGTLIGQIQFAQRMLGENVTALGANGDIARFGCKQTRKDNGKRNRAKRRCQDSFPDKES